jgi:F-type H+-transporting ATPase subunit alpha
LRNVPVNKVKEFETAFLTSLKKQHKKVLAELKAGKLTDNVLDTLNAVAQETSKAFE